MRSVKIILYAFAAMLLALPLHAQHQHKIDSLQSLIAGKIPDSVRVNALMHLSYEYQGFDTKKAFDFGHQMLDLARKTNNQRGCGDALNNLGDLYWYQSNLAEASRHYLQALDIFEKLGEEKEMASCYRNIGWIYFDRGQLDKANEYYHKSLRINLRLNRRKQLCENFNDIGIIHIHHKEYKEGIDSFECALKIEKEMNYQGRLVATLGNMAIAYDNLGQPQKAINCVLQAIAVCEKDGNKNDLAVSYCNLGTFYAGQGKYAQSISMLQKGLDCAKTLNYRDVIRDCYANLAETYVKMNNYEKAFECQRMVAAIKDSIYRISNSKQVNEMTAKYESEKKEIAIRSLEKDKAISAESLAREQNFRTYMILFIVLLAGFAIALFRGNRRRKTANEALAHAYHEIEIKNKDITDSISYSKRIQDASLPPHELRYRLFPDSFLFFCPKEIVSGDFFWFAEKDGKRLIAACDCTGHGVPGALMSMIGNNILNRIVNEKGVTAPTDILRLLDMEVRKALKQQEHPENNDGIDLALLSFSGENEIEFAGARRPVWIIRDQQLTEISPDDFSAGGVMINKEKIFTSHKMKLQKNDCVYLFTDGFADQAGGTEGRKFPEKKFAELLLTVSGETMAKQEKTVEGTFKRWKGNREQVDDVLVIGIRI